MPFDSTPVPPTDLIGTIRDLVQGSRRLVGMQSSFRQDLDRLVAAIDRLGTAVSAMDETIALAHEFSRLADR